MLFDLPDDDTLHAAPKARDTSFEGRAFVAVTSTGIFCRLNCPARDPKGENCRVFPTPAECLKAGFRPCRRCYPIGQNGPDVTRLLKALDGCPDHIRSERQVFNMGFDASRIRRKHSGFATLARGQRVIDAQVDAGFHSPSTFRDAFQRLTGIAPGQLRRNARLQADWIDTPLGPMIAVADATSLHLLEFLERSYLTKDQSHVK